MVRMAAAAASLRPRVCASWNMQQGGIQRTAHEAKASLAEMQSQMAAPSPP